MDFKAKTRSWLQNISQKLENFYVEVDSGLCAVEPMDILKNQLQSAQTTFRNLYSEFVEDVIPLISSHFDTNAVPHIPLDQTSNTTDITGHQEGSYKGIRGDHEDGICAENFLSHVATSELLVDMPLQQSDDTNLLSVANTAELHINTTLPESDDTASEDVLQNLSPELLKRLIPGIENTLREEKNHTEEPRINASPAPRVVISGVSKSNDDQFALPSSTPQESEVYTSLEEVDADISVFPADLSSCSAGSVSSDFSFPEIPPHDEYVDVVASASLPNSGSSDYRSAEEAMADYVVEPIMEFYESSYKKLVRNRTQMNAVKLSADSVVQAIRPHYLKQCDKEPAASKAKFAETQEEKPQLVFFEDLNAEAYHRAEEVVVTVTTSLTETAEMVKFPDESSDSDWEII